MYCSKKAEAKSALFDVLNAKCGIEINKMLNTDPFLCNDRV